MVNSSQHCPELLGFFAFVQQDRQSLVNKPGCQQGKERGICTDVFETGSHPVPGNIVPPHRAMMVGLNGNTKEFMGRPGTDSVVQDQRTVDGNAKTKGVDSETVFVVDKIDEIVVPERSYPIVLGIGEETARGYGYSRMAARTGGQVLTGNMSDGQRREHWVSGVAIAVSIIKVGDIESNVCCHRIHLFLEGQHLLEEVFRRAGILVKQENVIETHLACQFYASVEGRGETLIPTKGNKPDPLWNAEWKCDRCVVDYDYLATGRR